MPVVKVPSTELSRHFSEYLARVRYGGGVVIVLKNNCPVAELRPMPIERCSLREFLALWSRDPLDNRLGDDLEAVGRADRPPEDPWA